MSIRYYIIMLSLILEIYRRRAFVKSTSITEIMNRVKWTILSIVRTKIFIESYLFSSLYIHDIELFSSDPVVG